MDGLGLMDEGMDEIQLGARSRQGAAQDNLESFIKGLPRGLHLTAPEVYKQARDNGLKVSLSTVYRTLNTLSMQGQVQALAGEHGRRYEAAEPGHDHDHLICVKCGLTIEFEDDLIRGFGKSVADRKGYEYKHSRFDILGLCQNCKTQGDEHKIEMATASVEQLIGACESATADLEIALEQLSSRKFARAKELLENLLPTLQESCEELERCLENLESKPV